MFRRRAWKLPGQSLPSCTSSHFTGAHLLRGRGCAVNNQAGKGKWLCLAKPRCLSILCLNLLNQSCFVSSCEYQAHHLPFCRSCISLWGHSNVWTYICIHAKVWTFTGIHSPVKSLPLWRPRANCWPVCILFCKEQGTLKTIGRTFEYGIADFLCMCPRRGIYVQINLCNLNEVPINMFC